MFKSKKTYILILLAAIALLAFFDLYAPDEEDWTPDYTKEQKIPYGGWLAYEQLRLFLGNENVGVLSNTIYEENSMNHISIDDGYFFLNNNFYLDDADFYELTEFTGYGGTVFIAANSFPQKLKDTLNFEVLGRDTNLISEIIRDTSSRKFSFNREVSGITDTFSFKGAIQKTLFSVKDSQNITILSTDQEDNPVFISAEFGDGEFLLHAQPEVFSNLFLRDYTNANHYWKVLSHLPDRKFYWDNYYKAGRKQHILSGNELYFITGQPGLREAWYILLGGVVIMVILGIKRRQRYIPEIAPPKNSTLEFIRTIGTLFYENKGHEAIAKKMLRFFRFQLHRNYGLNINEPTGANEQAVKKLASLTGTNYKEMYYKIREINAAEYNSQLTKKDLKELYDNIYFINEKIANHGKS